MLSNIEVNSNITDTHVDEYALQLSRVIGRIAENLYAVHYSGENDVSQLKADELKNSLQELNQAIAAVDKIAREYAEALHECANPEGREDIREIWDRNRIVQEEMAEVLPAQVMKVVRDEHWGVGFDRVWKGHINGLPTPEYFKAEVEKMVATVRSLSDEAWQEILVEARN